MIETLATGIAAAGSLLALGGLGLELNYRLLPRGNKLELTAGEWHLAISEPNHYLLVGDMEFRNLTQRTIASPLPAALRPPFFPAPQLPGALESGLWELLRHRAQ